MITKKYQQNGHIRIFPIIIFFSGIGLGSFYDHRQGIF